MVSATMATRARAHGASRDSKSSEWKSSPGRRRSRGGRSWQRGRSRSALRGRRAGEEVRQQGAHVAEAAVHLFLHGHTSARAVVNGCGAAGRPRALEHTSTATQYLATHLLRRSSIRRLRRRLSGPPFDAASDAIFAYGAISPACGTAGRLPHGVRRLADPPRTNFTTTRDTDTGPIQTSRTFNNLTLHHFSASTSPFRARGGDTSAHGLCWARHQHKHHPACVQWSEHILKRGRM